MAAKRILIFSLAYYPHVGGAEVAIKEITDRIDPKEFEFHMLTLRFGDDARVERIGRVTVHRIGFGPSYLSKILFVPLSAFAAIRLHRTERFDGLWAMMSYMAFPITLMRLMGVRVPYALTIQDGDPFEHVFGRWYIRPFLLLLRAGFRNANAVSVLSAYLAEWVRRLEYRGAVAIVPNGADVRRFEAAAPRDIGRKPREVWLVTSSRLVHKNAVDDVIRALALLPDNFQFLVLGSGPDERMLKELAEECGVSGRVHFKGYVSHEELPGYLRACDIFVRPSRTEGFGASFVEAFAARIPVIATQEGGIADFLFDAERDPEVPATGWAVDKDSPESISEAVLSIVSAEDVAKKVVENAHRAAVEKYDWDIVARDMQEKVFQKMGMSG